MVGIGYDSNQVRFIRKSYILSERIVHQAQSSLRSLPCRHLFPLILGTHTFLLLDTSSSCHFTTQLPLSVTQSAFTSTSDRLFCFPCACVDLIGQQPSDYAHALSAYYYNTGRLSPCAQPLELPASQASQSRHISLIPDFLCFFFKVLKGYMKATSKLRPPHPTADSSFLRMRGRFWEMKPTCRSPTGSKFTNVLV